MTDPIIINIEVLSTPTFSNIFTTQSEHYIGQKARLRALPNGIALEVLNVSGDWIQQWAYTEA